MARLVLDDDMIRAHAGETYYARGLAYKRQGAVVELSADATAADATVAGTRRYHVHVELTGDGLDAECTCPLGAEDEFCKHAVATSLAWLEAVGEGGTTAADMPGLRRPKPDLAAFLAGQPTEWLVQWLLRVADADPALRAEWEALATRPGRLSRLDDQRP